MNASQPPKLQNAHARSQDHNIRNRLVFWIYLHAFEQEAQILIVSTSHHDVKEWTMVFLRRTKSTISSAKSVVSTRSFLRRPKRNISSAKSVASANAGGSSITKAAIRDYGEKKFKEMCRTHGRAYAERRVARYRSIIYETDTDSFGVEDTDLWLAEDSVECVLGAF